MSAVVTFTILGTPVPQGSTKAFWRPGMKHAVVTHDNAKSKPWRSDLCDSAHEAMAGRPPLEDVALDVDVMFFLPRPKSAKKSVTEPAKKPDVDKLLRAVLDALTIAGVWRDDAQVVCATARKAFAGGYRDPMGAHGIPRAVVTVRVAQPAAAQAPLLEARA